MKKILILRVQLKAEIITLNKNQCSCSPVARDWNGSEVEVKESHFMHEYALKTNPKTNG